MGQTVINGMFLGGIYALVAVGLTLIYGVMGIINFAQPDFLMLGMYLGYWAFTLFGVDPYVSIIPVAIVVSLVGGLIHSGLVHRILDSPPMNQTLLTFGISSLIMGLAQFSWGAQPRSVRVPYSANCLRAFGLILNLPRLIALITCVLLTVFLYLFLGYTKLGKAVRACSQSRDAAQLMGINVRRIYILTFAIGVALTGIAGVLLTPSYSMTPTVGWIFAMNIFVIVVLGTLGNFIGAFFGGLIIGVAEAFGGFFLGGALKPVVSMVIFILVLLLRPEGLFGRKS
jgi:branched-chain amino acid transport system permease protein